MTDQSLSERLRDSVCYASTNKEWPNNLLREAADALDALHDEREGLHLVAKIWREKCRTTQELLEVVKAERDELEAQIDEMKNDPEWTGFVQQRQIEELRGALNVCTSRRNAFRAIVQDIANGVPVFRDKAREVLKDE